MNVCMYIYIHIHTCSIVVKVRMNENAIMYECIYVCMYCSGETMYECKCKYVCTVCMYGMCVNYSVPSASCALRCE